MKSPRPSSPARPASRWLWGLLFAHLLLSPLLFCPATLDAFEINKALLLRATAILLAAAGLASAGGVGGLKPLAGRFRLGRPLPLGFVLLLVSGFASTVFSISPHTSLYGIPDSEAGFCTVLACAVLFFATFVLCPTADACRRLLIAPVVATALVTGYALLQLAGCDPVPVP